MMATPASRGFATVFRRAWNEIPDIVGGTALAVFGVLLGGVGLTNYYSKDGDNRRYKLGYVVMRHNDPRAGFVHDD